jgi:hypothetical protein
VRLVCPSCGAIASAEAWANDAAWRQCLQVALELPSAVQQRTLPYIGLFRPAPSPRAGEGGVRGKGLSSARALRLIKDLRDLVVRGSIQWAGGEERPAGSMLWAEALDAVLARRPTALENHNYLRRVAWEMAKGGAARVETRRELDRQAKSGARAPSPQPSPARGDVETEGEQPATPEQLEAVKATLRGFLAKE